ncbi:LacI family DNA-binding transcriptional regulator [Raineyella fluvialis]|uniref:LacI family DNA-binding transcriptional regulator n=1 Tax=Raineyella fluvialis TaxID=2662261 RepID=UPI001E613CD8|nr:LacI family DNA-binding transcriptional regulator [Raineyella fluvialis]
MARNPTQSDVARAVGVSRGLVSMALSGSPAVAEETRERILRVARELGYTRDLGAASLAARRSRVLGVVLPDLRNPFLEGIVSALQDEAESRGLVSLVATASDDVGRELTILRRFHELRVAGVVMVSPVQPPEGLERAGELMPLVLIGADGPWRSLDSVHVDEDAAARLIVDHVRERGWTSLISLSERKGPGEVWIQRRQVALSRAAAAVGLPFDAVAIDGDAAISAALLDHLHPGARLAVAAHNDLVAIDALTAVRAMGLVPGTDVGVVGFDDTHLARRPEFDITSVSQDSPDSPGWRCWRWGRSPRAAVSPVGAVANGWSTPTCPYEAPPSSPTPLPILCPNKDFTTKGSVGSLVARRLQRRVLKCLHKSRPP